MAYSVTVLRSLLRLYQRLDLQQVLHHLHPRLSEHHLLGLFEIFHLCLFWPSESFHLVGSGVQVFVDSEHLLLLLLFLDFFIIFA